MRLSKLDFLFILIVVMALGLIVWVFVTSQDRIQKIEMEADAPVNIHIPSSIK